MPATASARRARGSAVSGRALVLLSGAHGRAVGSSLTKTGRLAGEVRPTARDHLPPAVCSLRPNPGSPVTQQRVLLLATTTGYQTRSFGEAAERLGVEVALATDRCTTLEDPWRDRAVPIRFHDEPGSVAAIVREAARSPFAGVLAVGDRPVAIAAQAAAALGLPHHPVGCGARGAQQAPVARAAPRRRPSRAVVRVLCDRRSAAAACRGGAVALRDQAAGALRQPRRHSRETAVAELAAGPCPPRARCCSRARCARCAIPMRTPCSSRATSRATNTRSRGCSSTAGCGCWRSSTSRIRWTGRSSRRRSTSRLSRADAGRQRAHRARRRVGCQGIGSAPRPDSRRVPGRRRPRVRARSGRAADRRACAPARCGSRTAAADLAGGAAAAPRIGRVVCGMDARSGGFGRHDDSDSPPRRLPARGRTRRGARRATRHRDPDHGEARPDAGAAAGGRELPRVHLCSRGRSRPRSKRRFVPRTRGSPS